MGNETFLKGKGTKGQTRRIEGPNGEKSDSSRAGKGRRLGLREKEKKGGKR